MCEKRDYVCILCIICHIRNGLISQAVPRTIQKQSHQNNYFAMRNLRPKIEIQPKAKQRGVLRTYPKTKSTTQLFGVNVCAM